jgi:hypothetical protein
VQIKLSKLAYQTKNHHQISRNKRVNLLEKIFKEKKLGHRLLQLQILRKSKAKKIDKRKRLKDKAIELI